MSDRFDELLDIMTTLRGKNGCPWDREQTQASIKHYLIEEAYEVIEAIDEKKPAKIAGELGDLLYQIIFHAEMAKEAEEFDIDDVLSHLIDKMKRRHPHVFGNESASDSAEVLKRWEEIKKTEQEERKSVLDGVPKNLPSLLYCYQVQKRAARVGFDWQNKDQVIEKLHEEVREFNEAVASQNAARMEDELGDILFVIVNMARFLNIDPDLMMKKSTGKFIRRFTHMEEKAAQMKKEGISSGFQSMSLEEMDSLWEEVKKEEKT